MTCGRRTPDATKEIEMNGVQVEPKASKAKPSIERGRRGSRNLGRTVAPPIHLMAEMELRGARLG